MPTRRQFLLTASAAGLAPAPARAAPPADSRLNPPKTLDGFFPFAVPPTAAEWADRRTRLREQVMVALGLWPLPDRTPLDAVVHGRRERAGYSVEKVFFQSVPGHTVSGNLYRPLGEAGKRPAVLFAHGHWENGRLHDAGDGAARQAVEKGWEPDAARGRFFMQALPVGLARRGFVVFQHDMVGYADSSKLEHRTGFGDAPAEGRLLSVAGLQTWNSVRALDFLLGLPDVDPARVGVTGASGGGTQTFLLCAVDDRPAAAVPAVMVSTAMQGGCVCENASHLRVDTGNVELAALFAPKPLGLTAADDWTRELAAKGFPELQKLYARLGAAGKVAMHYKPHPHNYDRHSREFMTAFFCQHLKGEAGPAPEAPFEPLPPAELRVFDASHPRPANLGVRDLREALAAASDKQLRAMPPADFRRVVGTALRVLVHDELPPPKPGQVSVQDFASNPGPDGVTVHTARLGRGPGEGVRSVGLIPPGFAAAGNKVVVWADPAGVNGVRAGDGFAPGVAGLLKKGFGVFALDLFAPPAGLDVRKPSSGQTSGVFVWGYNRSVFAERVRDLLTGVANLRDNAGCPDVRLVGGGWAGPVALVAAALAGPAVTRVAIDGHNFRFDAVRDLLDPMLLPGAVKYGGLPGLGSRLAPVPLLLHHHPDGGDDLLTRAYAAAGAADKLRRQTGRLDPAAVADWVAG